MVNAIILFNLFLFRNSPAKSVAETTEQQNGSKSIFNSDVHASRKRPKLEIRRGETGNASQMESDTENTHVMNGLVLWDGIVVEEKESNELSQGQDRNINESVMKKPFGFGNKSQQCIAFIESKGRQCVCPGLVCSPLTCDHVYLFGDDFEEARDVYGKSMRCRFPYDDEERIILEGWGVRACEHILRGTFVCEYIGEVLDQQEANKRRIQYGKEGCSYIHDVDANINDIGRIMGEPDYVVDATTHVNVSRCSPNLVTHQDVEESMESLLARIGLYASTDGRLFFLFSVSLKEVSPNRSFMLCCNNR
uniref:SET domain-containing protein n=1 Tax=Brassica campestris TaxID=3711 RepID=M4FDN9_BRACM